MSTITGGCRCGAIRYEVEGRRDRACAVPLPRLPASRPALRSSAGRIISEESALQGDQGRAQDLQFLGTRPAAPCGHCGTPGLFYINARQCCRRSSASRVRLTDNPEVVAGGDATSRSLSGFAGSSMRTGLPAFERYPPPAVAAESDAGAAPHQLLVLAVLSSAAPQALRQLHRIVVGPEVHEEQPRLLVQHVAVQRRDLDAVRCAAP